MDKNDKYSHLKRQHGFAFSPNGLCDSDHYLYLQADVLDDNYSYSERRSLQDLGKLMIGEAAKEALECDLKLEQAARPVLQEAIACCETVKGYISREILEGILESEEEHIDFLETQLGLITDIGLQNWLQSQSGPVS